MMSEEESDGERERECAMYYIQRGRGAEQVKYER